FARLEHTFESNGKAEHQRSTDDEVGDLHPTPPAQAERADIVAPGIVVRAQSPFDKEHDDEEQRTDHAAGEQESERHWPLSEALRCGCHSLLLLCDKAHDQIAKVGHARCLSKQYRREDEAS